TDLLALAAALRETGGDAESAAIIDNLIASLKEPFIFVVVGEVNVGKSSFLNALFGQDFSNTGILPTTDKILFFKHGDQHQIVPVTDTLDEVHAPVDFLRDFHIVDTPGTNSIENEHQQITERFVPIADLVIFVFSAMNPWGASAWQFLEKVHREWMRHVVFVLQQCDLRSPEEIQVITDYMGQLTRQRFGRDFPLFPVSAKKAFLARNSGIDHDRLLQDSGFAALQGHVSDLVRRNASRQQKLSSTVRLARQILDQLNGRVADAMRQLRRRTVVLQELQVERELQVDRTLKKILPAFDATERDYHESILRVAGLAGDALATRKAFQRPPTRDEEEAAAARPQSLDHRLFQELQHRTGDRWRQVGLVLEEDLHQFERYLYAQGKGTLFPADVSMPVHDYNDDESELRRRFGTHVDSSLRRFVLGLKLDEDIEPGLERARSTARWVPRLLPLAVIAIALCAWLDGLVGASIATGAAAMLLMAVYLMTQIRLSTARNAILDKLEISSATLRETLSKQVRGDVTEVFAKFVDLLDPAQSNAAQLEQDHAVHVARLRRLTDSLSDLDHQIQSVMPAHPPGR
ncbi:MAG TPA: dynamin family protein, partial [Prosthecobacter sp.]